MNVKIRIIRTKCHFYSYLCQQNDKTQMERLLHYVWMHKLLPSKVLTTTDGRSIEILDPGQHNTNQGPDFSNVRMRMDLSLIHI